jgi:hypothetical protein
MRYRILWGQRALRPSSANQSEAQGGGMNPSVQPIAAVRARP